MTTDEETQAMSRLLMRGAKMLQKGCEDCGNPLFRYQGEVVCPVCRERADATAAREPKETDDEKAEAVETGEEKRREDKEAAESGETSGTRGRRDKRGETEVSKEQTTAGDEWREETAENLRKLARRLSSEAADEDDLSRLNGKLDTVERTVELVERLEER